jgi:hypothetical protein
MDEIIIYIPNQQNDISDNTSEESEAPEIPKCEKNINKMLKLTFTSFIRSDNKIIKYTIPFICNVISIVAIFSMLWYPSYYINQGLIWTIDLVIGIIVFNYLLFLQTIWEKASRHEAIQILKWKENLSLFFYVFFMIYWFYFAIIQFYEHRENTILGQFGNLLMSTAWYIFFSVISFLYYYICIKLSQRSHRIKDFFKKTKRTKPNLDTFIHQYNDNHKKIKKFGKYWNLIILFGFLLLTFHVPLDLIAIIYHKVYYDIFGFIIKLSALIWYTYCICHLNDYDNKIIPYLYKHKIYDAETIEKLEKYVSYRKIGLSFFGLSIDGKQIVKIGLIILNLIIPTLYALFSSHIINL